LYPLALGASFYADMKGITRLRLKEWMWRVLALVYVPFAFLDAAALSSHVLALVHMTLFLSAAKLFQNKRDRDWVFLYLIAFFQIPLASGLTFNATFVASLGVFLFFFVSSLAAFEIRRARREITMLDEEVVTRSNLRQSKETRQTKEARQAKAAATERNSRAPRRIRYLVGASAAQIALVALLAVPFFFFIPRFGGGGVASGFGESQALTGFSDTVRLGEVASIKENKRVVMRIELDRKPGKYVRWRGVALDRYTDGVWTLSQLGERQGERLRSSDQNARTQSGPVSNDEFVRNHQLYDSQQAYTPPADRQLVLEQRVVLEPLDTPHLFAAQRPFKLSGAISPINWDKYTTAISAVGLRGRTSYTVFSDLRVPTEQELRAEPVPRQALLPAERNLARLYLQLPDRLDSRIESLAREITRNAVTDYDRARAIESYLKKFKYTLDLKPTEGDPLAEFLFETREGHCEYFATAMTVLLRTLDIPARIVNGFQMGEYNDLNNLYTVRASDAHSWVEVYFPQKEAWVEFDPTPPGGINDYSQGGFFARLKNYIDAAEVFWLDYVVTLDGDEQASIMVDLQQRLLALKDTLAFYYFSARMWVADVASSLLVERPWDVGRVLKVVIAVAILLATIVAVYVFTAFLKRRGLATTGYGPWWHRLFVLPTWRSRRLVERDRRQSAVLFYEQMLAIAARAGFVKSPDQTPSEFAFASRLSEIDEITRVYNRVRFGGAQLDEKEVRRVSSLLADLKRAVRQGRFS
ncbi:MAG TPA: DUF3488 and transglutaminase-like domain-containing protein, partial [Blastocatellia bacterium]|nr:DUF3488 and transglutaminase-like domain-containing protein [Blastocatellia bacterium]